MVNPSENNTTLHQPESHEAAADALKSKQGDEPTDEETPLVLIKSPDFQPDESTFKKTKLPVEFQSLSKEQLEHFAKDPFWRRLRLIFFILFWVVWLAMLAAVVVIIVVSPKCPPRPPRQFWQKPFYRLSVKSFAPATETDPTAPGSIDGLERKMDYLRETLGFNNFILDSLVSRDATSGCPTDFRAHNSSLMTLDSLKALTKKGRKKGFSFLMEFDASQADLTFDPSMSAFLTADLSTVPSWAKLVSRNNGKALRESRLHLPRNACPSLNVTAPLVIDRIESALNFWLDAGLSGFVLTNVAFMSPAIESSARLALTGGQWRDADPTPLLFSEASVEFVRRLRQFINTQAEKRGRELALFVEPGNTGFLQPPDRLAAYLDPKAGAHAVVSTALGTPLPSWSPNSASSPRKTILDTLAAVGSNGSVLFASAWPSLRRPSELHLTALSLLLPGVPCLYYGQELGMTHVPGVRLHGSGLSSYLPDDESTDQSETPMQWSDDVANAGWLSNASTPLTWVNLTARAGDIAQHNLRLLSSSGNAAPQLELVKSLVKLIGSAESLQWGGIDFLPTGADGSIVAFKREAERFPPVLVVMNTGEKEATLGLGTQIKVTTGTLKVALNTSERSSSYKLGEDYSLGVIYVPAKSILVFQAKTEAA